MSWAKFGPGTLTVTVGTGTAQQMEMEVKGVTINHAYEEVGEAVTYLSGTSTPTNDVRADSITVSYDFDLTATGAYAYLYTHDLQDAEVTYVATADSATWSGTFRLRLPESIGAEAFGSKISGDVTWPAVGPITFAPEGTPEP